MPARYNDLELHVVGKTTPNRKRSKDRISSNRTVKRPPPISITPVNVDPRLLTDEIDVIPATPSPVNHEPFDDIIPETPPEIMATYQSDPLYVFNPIGTRETIPYVGSLKRKSSAYELDVELLARAQKRRDDLERFLRAQEEQRVQDALFAADAVHVDDELASTENSLPRSETVPNENNLSRLDSFIPESAPSSLPTTNLIHRYATNSSFHNSCDDVVFNQSIDQSNNQSSIISGSPSNEQLCNQSNNDVTAEPSMVESVRSDHNATFNATFEASIIDWSCDISTSGTLDASMRSVDMSFRSPVCDTPTRLSNSNSQFAYPTYTDSMARRNHHLPTLFPVMRNHLNTPQTQSQSSHNSPSFITPAKLSQLSNESVYGSPDLNQSRVSMGLIAPHPCLPNHMNEELRTFHDRMNSVFEVIKRSQRDKYWLTLLHYAIAALKIHARAEGLSATVQTLQRTSGCTPAIVAFVQSFDLSDASVQADVPNQSMVPAGASDGEEFPIDPTPVIVVTPEDYQTPATVPQQEPVSQHDQLHLSLSLPVSEASASSLTQSLNPDREANNFIYPIVMSLEVAQSA